MEDMKCRARQWPIVFAAFLTQALTFGYAASMGVFYVEWKNAFAGDLPGDGSSSLGWLTSSVLSVMLATAPLSGALVHHYGVRPVVMAGGLLSTMGLFISSFAKSVYVLFFTVPLMTGLGCGLSFAASVTVITQYFHKHFALASGIASTGTSVGVVTLPIIIQALVNYYTWRNAIMVVAGIQAQVVICGSLMKPKKVQRPKKAIEAGAANERHMTDRIARENKASPKIPDEDNGSIETDIQNGGDSTTVRPGSGIALDSLDTKKHIKTSSEHRTADRIATHENKASPNITDEDNGNIEPDIQNGGDSTTALPRSSRFRVALDSLGISLIWTNRVYACILPMFLCGGAAYSTTVIYIKERAKQVGVPDFQSALLISIIGFSDFFARAGHGHFLDAKIFHPISLYCFANFLAALALPIISVSEHYAVFVACAVAIGFAVGLYIPISVVIVRHIVGVHHFPGGMGLGLFFVAASSMSTVALGGYLLDTTGDYLAGFLYAGLLQGTSGIVALINHFVWTRCIKDSRWPPRLPPVCKKSHQDDQPPTPDCKGIPNPAMIL